MRLLIFPSAVVVVVDALIIIIVLIPYSISHSRSSCASAFALRDLTRIVRIFEQTRNKIRSTGRVVVDCWHNSKQQPSKDVDYLFDRFCVCVNMARNRIECAPRQLYPIAILYDDDGDGCYSFICCIFIYFGFLRSRASQHSVNSKRYVLDECVMPSHSLHGDMECTIHIVKEPMRTMLQ